MTTAQVVREPLYRTVPDCRSSFGDLAARVGVELGLPPDDEQRVALDAMFAEVSPGLPRYRHACVVATRQQLKSATLTIAAATDLLLLGVPGAVWTAHQSKTATKSYEDLSRRIRAHDEYREVCDFRAGRGEEAIFLLDDPAVSLEYRARSGGSGRGFTTGRLTLDEALFLRPGDIGALAPTMLTRREGQIRYGSSAGLPGSQVLRDLRDDGRGGTDPGLWYVEYGSDPRDCTDPHCAHELTRQGCALDDRELWWQSCPALWCGRVREDDVADLRRRMPAAEFAREVLGWWDDPPNAHGGGLDSNRWLTLADTAAKPGVPLVFGVDQGEDRTVSIGCAWRRPNGQVQVMLGQEDAEHVDVGLSPTQAVARLAALRERWGGRVVLGGPALGLERDLLTAGVPSDAMNGIDFATASGQFDDRLRAGSLQHGNQDALNASVRLARWRQVGSAGERAFQLKDAPGVGPLAAVTRALGGLLSRPASTFDPVAITTPSTTSHLADMQF